MNKIILIFILAYASSLFGQNTEDFYSNFKKDQLIQIYLPMVKVSRELDSYNAIYVNNKSKIDSFLPENIILKDSLSMLEKYEETLELSKSDLEQYIKIQKNSDSREKKYCFNELKTLIKMNKDENISLIDFKSDLIGKTWKFCPSIEQFNPDLEWSNYKYKNDIHSVKFLNEDMCEVYFRENTTNYAENDGTLEWSWSLNMKSEKPKTGYYKLFKLSENHYIIKLNTILGQETVNLKTTKDGIYYHNNFFGLLKK